MSTHLYNKLSRRFCRDSLQDVVGHHLTELMNCAIRGARLDASADSPVVHSVLNYGCPPLKIAGASRVDPMGTAAHICKVMRVFESRVDSAKTSVKPRQSERRAPQILYFDIQTTARDDGAEIRVSLALDYLNGFFSLVDD